MTYTQLAICGVLVMAACDMWLLRTRLVTRKVFWYSYGVIVVFQLISNGFLTGYEIVQYDGAKIVGDTSPTNAAPPFIGHGRICFAPVEDLLFGFALILMTLSLWMWLGKRNIQRTPTAGPPRRIVQKFVGYKP